MKTSVKGKANKRGEPELRAGHESWSVDAARECELSMVFCDRFAYMD
jgi:hypothetical protein